MPRAWNPAERAIIAAYLADQLESIRAVEVSPAPAPPKPPAAAYDHRGFADQKAEGRFYDFLRDNDLLGPVLSAGEFQGCDAITRAAAQASWTISYTAYGLATAYLETNHTMLPVKEAYWLKPAAQEAYYRRMYDIQGARPAKARELGNLNPGDGSRYPGRGYPQVTGLNNYRKVGDALGVDLVANPDLLLTPKVAAQAMIWGMTTGAFTGKKLSDFLPSSGQASRAQFVKCRPIINGTDRAGDIADYAVVFQSALAAGPWQL